MSIDYSPIPTTAPGSLLAAESLLFPATCSTPGLQLVRARFPGGEYTSTGMFRSADIGSNGTGRTEANCQRLLSVFFDTDIVGLFKAKYLAAGKPSLGKRVAAWKSAMYRYNGARLEAAKQKHGALVYHALVGLLGEPTAVVDSGWGFHYFYALGSEVKPSSLPAVIELHNRVRPLVHERVSEAWGCAFPDAVLDATQDAGTRMVRTWGTMNTKAPNNPRPCVPLAATCRTIGGQELVNLINQLPKPQLEMKAKPRKKMPAAEAVAGMTAPRKGKPLDFTAHTHNGQTWLDIAAGLEVGGTYKLTCPFAGTSDGSGFISRKTATRALFRSNAMGRTFWAKQLILGDGRADLDVSDKGGVRQTISNVYRLLREDESIDLWTCSFRQLPLLGLELLDPKLMQTRVRRLAEDRYGWSITVARADVENAIFDVCAETERNGISEQLDALKWDGKKRLFYWLAKTLGLSRQHAPLLSAYGRRWLISLVARCYQPGCKVDTMLVILGRQGFGKSSMFKDIAGFFGEDLFVDTAVDWRHKDSRDVLRGTLIYEDAELESFHRAGVDLMKNLLSSEIDTYRAAYGRTRQRFPRTALMVGTANPIDILKDQTGNRRFWLVNAYQSERTCYDKRWLFENIEQMVAEAVVLYKQHDASPSEATQWWLTAAEQSLSDSDNQQALQEDLLAAAAERVFALNNGAVGSWFTAHDFVREFVNAHSISSPSSRQLHGMVQKASHSLRAIGFERHKVTNPANGKRANWYMKVVSVIPDGQPNNGLHAVCADAAEATTPLIVVGSPQ